MTDWSMAAWERLDAGSDATETVEFARLGDTIGLRKADRDTRSVVLEFTEYEWSAFVAGVRDGQFELHPLR